MTNISGNPREQVKKKITENFQSVIIDASRYEGEDGDKYFNVKMDEAYENVLRDKKLMDECGLFEPKFVVKSVNDVLVSDILYTLTSWHT